jgi:DNA polymerase-3 subunit alpha
MKSDASAPKGVKSPKAAPALKPEDFVHLHNHSHHSLLDGLTKIEPMLDRVQELGMSACAITDHGTLSGVIEFYKAAKARDIKPIIGMECYVANRGHTDKDPMEDRGRYHLILLAMNFQGYQNLMRLSTIANLEGFYYKPRVDRALLERYNEGLIATSACIGGEIGESLQADQDKKAEAAARWLAQTFKDRFYFEFQDTAHEWPVQAAFHEKLLKLAGKLQIPCVVTADAHYLMPEDKEAHEVLLCVQTSSLLSDPNRFSLSDTNIYLKTPTEIIGRWGKEHPDFITNTRAIAERCELEIPIGEMLLPTFPVPAGRTDKDLIKEQTLRGLAWRYGGQSRADAAKLTVPAARKLLSPEVMERADYELGVISKMGFDSYFLIVSDFIQWGKDQGIVFGPGRGSTAGSIVAYALNITDIDPLKYDLLFERFLNPDRISMPDADIDIQDDRRDEVIGYVTEKYGKDRVAHIVTFGRMAARNAIRDVARVLDVPYAVADQLAKMVPPPIQGRHTPLKKHLEEVPELAGEYATSEDAKRVIDLAIKLEGTIRSHGVHAAGVVIAPDDIVKFAPLEMAQKGVVATQYSMGPIEDVGLVKMDFLGLSNLTIIKNALRIVRKVYGEELAVGDIPLDDAKAFELLSRGDTTGVFQLESSGMKRYLKDLKPTVFDDIIAMVALYRPGPLSAGLTDKFIARKNGLEEVTYDHSLMKPALESTYGVMVYQEQFMQIAKEMCGFSGGESDTLRKAVGKKNRELMAKMKTGVVEGAVKNGVDKKIAEKFWTDLEGFADYAFNKSHAACYGLIAYWTAYLKANYPAAFMAAVMTSDYDNTDRLSIEISECEHMGLTVLPPDINESFHEFGVVPETGHIRYGLDAIKNVGRGAVEEIIRARDESGKFGSVEDFAGRVSLRLVNRKTLECLVKAGAFDSLEPNRQKMLINLDNLIGFAGRLQKAEDTGQQDLFGGSIEPTLQPVLQWEEVAADADNRQKLLWERELLGIYLSSHPLEQHAQYLMENTRQLNKISAADDGKRVSIGGLITGLREITTKNGGRMAFVRIADMTGEIEVIIFPNLYNDRRDVLVPDTVVKISGKLNSRGRDGREEGELKVLADSVDKITTDAAFDPDTESGELAIPAAEPVAAEKPAGSKSARLFIRIHDPDDHSLLKAMKQAVSKHPGRTPVVVVLDGAHRQAIRLPFGVETSEAALRDLQEVLPAKDVVLQ